MSDRFADVYAFHVDKCPERVGTTPAMPEEHVVLSRLEMLKQEWHELLEAIMAGDLPGIADGVADLEYVLEGLDVDCGIDSRPVWNAVHAANMLKDGKHREPWGKIKKPDGWQHPDIKAILGRQASLQLIAAADAEPGGLMACSPELMTAFEEASRRYDAAIKAVAGLPTHVLETLAKHTNDYVRLKDLADYANCTADGVIFTGVPGDE